MKSSTILILLLYFVIFQLFQTKPFVWTLLLQESVWAYSRWRLRPRPRLRGCRRWLFPFRRSSCHVRYSWCRHVPCGVCSWHHTGLNHLTDYLSTSLTKTANTCHLCHQLSGVSEDRDKRSSLLCLSKRKCEVDGQHQLRW